MNGLPQPIDSGIRLGLVAALAVAALAAVFNLTRGPIAEQERQAELASLNAALPADLYDNDILADSIEVVAPEFLGNAQPHKVYRGRKNGEPSALAIRATAPDGYNGPIELLIGLRANGELTGVRVISHRETPGIGDKIDLRVTDWLLSFDGRSLGDPPAERWTVAPDGGAFEAFSGATITPRAVVKQVRRTLEYYSENRESLFARPAEPSDG
ncbi:MAG: electron transport complex subunit RsxG [Xanthomonadales bacterium]|nr:electron transport complex subunit RsxG [Xanthomonadales bacterium]